jgi:signal transduction histidine kinase
MPRVPLRRPRSWRDFALAVAPAIVVFALIVAVTLALRAQNASRTGVNHTTESLMMQMQILSRLKDAETGHRGYLLTAEEEYLAPYFVAVESLAVDERRLRLLAADHPAQIPRLDTLAAMIDRRLALFDTNIGRMRSGDRAGALAVIRSGEGRRHMDTIRSVMGRMQREEWRLHAESQSREANLARLTLVLLVVGGLAAVAVSYFMSRVLSRHARDMEAQAELAREGADAKMRFLATMSHELRTPLNAILGYTDLIDTGIGDPSLNSDKSYVSRTRTAARHLKSLIDDVLTIAKPEQSAEKVTLEPVKLCDLLDDVSAVIAPLAQKKQLHYEVSCDFDGDEAMLDRRRVSQILMNVLGNSVKFTSSGSVRLDVDRADGALVFSVRDTGRGIAPNEMDRIFEPFWQSPRTRAELHSGVGLGLSVSRQLARAMNGDLTVRSTLGSGAEFRLTVPFVQPPLLIERESESRHEANTV